MASCRNLEAARGGIRLGRGAIKQQLCDDKSISRGRDRGGLAEDSCWRLN